jgi:hypothetical protein
MKKKRRSPKKGGAFERLICKQLSLWWTAGERDDIFWRTAGSGARATTRSKRGRGTKNQYGDVQATDPIGQPLIDLCTIEIKKGYSRNSYFDLIDKLPNETKQPYKKFIQQAINQHYEAGTEWWLLITKRDYKETLIAMPLGLKFILSKVLNECVPSMEFVFNLSPIEEIFVTTLAEFCRVVSPKHIKYLSD